MVNMGLISFERTDFSIPSHIEQYAKEFAEHFKARRDYVGDFCKLIFTSKRWEIDNIETQVTRWSENFGRIKGRTKIIDIVKRAFLSCQNDDEISDLRGVMVEALIIGCNGGPSVLNHSNYGWGARVDINLPQQTIQVRYNCTDHLTSDCRRRSTVDFGYWDGNHGQFYECKAQPAGIGCKEVKFMEKLKSELSTHEISHEIFFVCPESTESIQMRLDSFGLRPVYKPLGIDEIRLRMPA
ncbi:hypothetical protein HPT25_14395 [Bacillus sp. BRMEA1]|uniref:hypothetical protein n=1 Tax=Neobacillus endophyticus TaxID=2738405 RepID=UPI0015659197|nr:hypothetical protein [Neobacillus endophyticus]NRD78550.1 hypothetical protein [Neobacillus endophyticus]